MWETWVHSLDLEDPWGRERIPTSVFWPGEFHGLCSPWGCKESGTRLSDFHFYILPFKLAFNYSSSSSISVSQLCPTPCNPMNHSTPGLHVHHKLPEFTQTHVHQVGDAIQPSHSLSSPSPPAPIPPSIRVFSNESTLHMRWPKYWSFSFSISPSNEHPGQFPLGWIGWITLQSKGLSRVFSNPTVQKHQFFGTQLSSQSNSHIHP